MKKVFAVLLSALVTLGSYAEDTTPASIITKFETVLAGITDYRVQAFGWSVKGSVREERAMVFSFKRPRMIRFDVVDSKKLFDTGSVGIYKGGSDVEGKMGGIMSIFPVKADKNDPLVTSIRGIRLDESDLIGILAKLKYYLNNCVTSAYVLADGTVVLTGIDNEKSISGKTAREILYFDPKSFLPQKMEGFDGDEQVEYIVWSDYVLNTGLPDAMFDINSPPPKVK